MDETYLGGPEAGLKGGRQLLSDLGYRYRPREFASRFNRRRTPMAAFQTLLGLASCVYGPTIYVVPRSELAR